MVVVPPALQADIGFVHSKSLAFIELICAKDIVDMHTQNISINCFIILYFILYKVNYEKCKLCNHNFQ